MGRRHKPRERDGQQKPRDRNRERIIEREREVDTGRDRNSRSGLRERNIKRRETKR